MSKFNVILSIAAVLTGLFFINKSIKDKNIKEDWWGGAGFQVRAVPGVKNVKTGKETALTTSFVDPNAYKKGQFMQTPSFQSMLSPRFSNIDYGAHIKYDLPSRDNMAVPCDPLTFANMAGSNGDNKENFCSSCGGGGCGGQCGSLRSDASMKAPGSYDLPAGYANGNYWDEYNKSGEQHPVEMGANLPIGTMSTSDGLGDNSQYVVFNRLMFSNRPPSRKFAAGDWIRGDLAITPCSNGWFDVHPDISRDLNPGAMGVLAGAGGGGDNHNTLTRMLVDASGGVNTTFAGVDLSTLTPQSVQQNAQTALSASAALTDINATAFP